MCVRVYVLLIRNTIVVEGALCFIDDKVAGIDNRRLTLLSLDKMAAILQTASSNAFS